MNLQNDKLVAFDHVVFKLTQWYKEQYGQWESNDFSKLKITKLLFFVTAITTNSEQEGLLKTFDSFAALPYGHVESYIQDHMSESANYTINRNNVMLKSNIQNYVPGSFIHDDVAELIDNAVESLKIKNPGLINYDQFSLVDLSHRWQSWKTVFELAKRNGKYSMPIPKEMIMHEPKIFK